MSTPKTVLGGDDVHALVIDCGSWAVRIGYAGDDSPRSIIPSAVGVRSAASTTGGDVDMTDVNATASPTNKPTYVAGDTMLAASHLLPDVEPLYTLDPATGSARVRNWDAMLSVWKSGLKSLHLDTTTHPLMLVEPSRMWDDAERRAALSLAFEGLRVPSAYIGRGAAMAAFAASRATACVLDIGAQGATAIPVVDGYALQRAARRTCLGGALLTHRLADWAELVLRDRDGGEAADPRARLRAHHELKRERVVVADGEPGDQRQFSVSDLSATQTGFSDAHRQFYRLRVMDDVKASLLRVDATLKTGTENAKTDDAAAEPTDTAVDDKDKEKDKDKDKDVKENGSKAGAGAKPDATGINGEPFAKYTLPDGNELSLGDRDGASIAEGLFTNDPDNHLTSLTDLVLDSIGGCDVDNRRELFAGVVVVGGSSLIPGCVERLTKQLAVAIPQTYKLKLHAAVNNTERTCAGWIGGSIVASLGTFQQAWISRQDYEELGADRALLKCP